jgi:hypothetical protein
VTSEDRNSGVVAVRRRRLMPECMGREVPLAVTNCRAARADRRLNKWGPEAPFVSNSGCKSARKLDTHTRKEQEQQSRA